MILSTFFFFVFSLFSPPQEDILETISTALAAGSSKELIKYCADNVEIKIDGKSGTYSLPQAEVLLRDFFLAKPARGFRYVHQGSSPEGLKYSIGTLDLDGGSYRVVMVIKKVSGVFKIDQINLSKE